MDDGREYVYRALGAPAVLQDRRRAATLKLLSDHYGTASKSEILNAKRTLSGGTDSEVLALAHAVLDAVGAALVDGSFDSAVLDLPDARRDLEAALAEAVEGGGHQKGSATAMISLAVGRTLILMAERPDLRVDLTSTNL